MEKSYSKVDYDKLDGNAEQIRKELREKKDNSMEDFLKYMKEYVEKKYVDSAKHDIAEMQKDLEAYSEIQDELRRMREQAHGEALELNEEYDRLIEKTKKAMDELSRFETEKLEIHKDKSESQN